MDKIYNQTKVEKIWYKFWEDSGFFKPDPKSQKVPFGILMPPPNLTGELHLGHAMQHSILDAIARFKRMQGYEVLLLPGVDHAGILFEGTLNKLLSKEGLTKEKLGREKWLERAWKFKDEVYKSFHKTWTIFGISADWSKEVFTLDPKVQRAVFEQFKMFWEQDLLYKGAYIVQWCPKCGTAIEDVEMEYQEAEEKLYYVRYQIADSKEYITVATARPETISADVAIATYHNHPKYNKLVGKFGVNPFSLTEIPIIEDARVEKDFGTGALKITPGHDLLDFQIGKDHNLPILHTVDKHGHITELDPDLAGLPALEARIKAAQKLQRLGLIEKEKDYTHFVPVCERCKTVVEPLISEEWFVKTKPIVKKALKNIDKINFYPKQYLKVLTDWLKDIHDWSISRSLWWGHRIPVWYCQKCNPNHEVGKDKDMTVSQDRPKHPCKSCQGHNFVQDEQVLDTWFSSGLWPLSTLGWPDETADLKKYYPWGFEISGPDIRYLWIARMIMLGLWFQDDIPFKNMLFHGTLRDLQGRRFSKSLGNAFDILKVAKDYGLDATRMALYTYSIPGRDGKTSKQVMSERAKAFRNFMTKLRNIGRFIIDLKLEGSETKLEFSHPDDAWIKKELDQTVKDTTKNLEQFKLHLATEVLYDFIWHKFADVYIEKAKHRRTETQPVLEYVFKTSLELLHPFMPFITEELWQRLPHKGQSIMLVSWPAVKKV